MNLEEALSAFPPQSPYRQIIPGLLDIKESVRKEALDRLRKLEREQTAEDVMATTWRHSETEALALIAAAIYLPFPPPEHDWEDAVHDLIFPLVRSPHPALIPLARQAYPRLSGRAKCAILAVLGACGTREAADAFLDCVRKAGWPDGVYQRVFTELPKLADHAHALLPDLIEVAGPNLGGITDFFVSAVAAGKVDLSAGKFATFGPFVGKQLQMAIEAAEKRPPGNGIGWRFSEEYWHVRQPAGCWLDIAGYLKTDMVEPLLQYALQLPDPLLVMYALISLLRRGSTVAPSALQRVAACHETREYLFNSLKGMDQLALFPASFRTWDAFAAANMTSWLLYPTELGREPDALEKMAIFTSDKPEGEVALYVWRFRTEDGPWYAAVSGPHLRKGEPEPLHGDLTFSRFDEWDNATPEEHAEAVLETLEEWRRAKT